MDMAAFFTVHQDLPREGPGSPEDVSWACDLAGVAADAVVLDAGAGPGGDVAALLAAVPSGRVVAVDTHADFVADMQDRFADEPRLTARAQSMAEAADFPEVPFDLIWCAGALYFLGLEDGIATLSKALKPGGALAFSHPCFFTRTPSPRALAFWEGETDPPLFVDDLVAKVEALGARVLGHRKVSDAGWEAYYQPMEARIASLRSGADAALTKALDANAAEARNWREIRDETGYLLMVLTWA